MFIVAFNRDRDSYQVPLALAESQQLAMLVTDYYHGSNLILLKVLRHRITPGIETGQVRGTSAAVAWQACWKASRRWMPGIPFPESRVDRTIANNALRQARALPGADLLLYSTFALPAFRALPERRRYLFQFHPHPTLIANTLIADSVRFAHIDFAPEPELSDGRRQADERSEEIELADRVLCASTFTAKSIEFSTNSLAHSVIPYGCEPALPHNFVSPPTRSGRVKLLFVGQGVQRKGLHHLFKIWPTLRSRFELTLILTCPDPAIMALLPEGVIVRGRVHAEQISAAMADADVFVLPSLIEGFGLVLGEALAHGCHLVASTHTGLPDMSLPATAATTYDSGSIDGLLDALLQAASVVQDPSFSSEEIAVLGGSWAAFRRGVREGVN